MSRPLGTIGAFTDAARAVTRAEAKVVRAAMAWATTALDRTHLLAAAWALARARKDRAAAKRALRKRIRASQKGGAS